MITPTLQDAHVRNALKREDGVSVVFIDVHTTYRVLKIEVLAAPPLEVPFNEPFNAEIPWLPFKQVALQQAILQMAKWN